MRKVFDIEAMEGDDSGLEGKTAKRKIPKEAKSINKEHLHK